VPEAKLEGARIIERATSPAHNERREVRALKNRFQTFVMFAVLAVGLLATGILGLWSYMNATATPLHPDAANVPSVTHEAPVPAWADAADEARSRVRASLARLNLPGLSVAVGVAGDLVWAEGFGWADLEKRLAVAPDMRFRIGTASVALTSAAAGLLVEDGRLDLDEVIQTYVPEFPEKEWPVTLRQLMAHTAGVRNDGGDEGPLLSAHCDQTTDALPYFAERPLLFEPGTRYRYSSYGWILVSAAVEAAADDSLEKFMERRIFEPLGMRDTEPDRANEPITNQVTSYFPRFGADPHYGLHLMRPIDYSCYAGSSVFLSTPSDLVRFGMAMTNGTLLKAATVELLQTPQQLASGDETGYGLGWDLERVTFAGGETRWAGHEGTSLGGMVASLITFPDRGLVVAVTSNISYADTETIALDVADAFATGSAVTRREAP